MKINHILGVIVALLIVAGVLMIAGKETKPQEEIGDTITINEEVTNTEDGSEEIAKEVNTNQKTNTMETQKVTFETTEGNIVLELYTKQTPKTAENFISLAGEGFYDGVRFHRVIEGFMIQSGDPLSKDDALAAQWGTGGPGYQFDDEIVEGLSNVPGTISMANAGPGTNGSQFFINTGSNAFLDGKHSVFGAVIEGMDIVAKIEKTETLPGDQPATPITITKVVVEA